MKKKFVLVCSLLLALISQPSIASSSTIEVGDQFVLHKKIDFLTMDFGGIFNVFDIFQEWTTLYPGHTFTVTDVHTPCESEYYQGKYLDSCDLTLRLEAESCGKADTETVYEQVHKHKSRFTFRVENGICYISLYETIHGSMFSDATVEKVFKKTNLTDFFTKVID